MCCVYAFGNGLNSDECRYNNGIGPVISLKSGIPVEIEDER